jgi:hypothetical protein
MNDWIIITPEGITKSPNNTIYENFQVFGFVFASTKETVLRKLKEIMRTLMEVDLMRCGFIN